MSIVAASTKGVNRDNIRTIVIQQVVANPQTTGPNNPYGNTIVYNLPYAQSLAQCEVALGNIYLFYSWYNIQVSFGNNTFAYLWPNGGGTFTSYPVTVPDGFYSIDDLNAYFQQVQVNNGTYLINADGINVYFIGFQSNPTYYRTTLTVYPVPDTLVGPPVYTMPANYPGTLPPTPTDPELVINATPFPAGSNTPGSYSFSKTLGFLPGTYPSTTQTATYYVNGQYAPIIESTANVLIRCNLVNTNGLSNIGQCLYTLSPTVAFGDQIQEKPYFPLYMQVADGFYQQIIIQIMDENQVPLNLQDPHISLMLLIRGI
jgi:hypothetical protein